MTEIEKTVKGFLFCEKSVVNLQKVCYNVRKSV